VWKGIVHKILPVTVLYVGFALVFYIAPSNTELFFISGTNVEITDFAYHILLIKAFWFEGVGDIYRLQSQTRVLSLVAGREARRAMPIGVTPIAAIVWFPFAAIACLSLRLSNTLWVTSSLSLLLAAMWRMDKTAHAGVGRPTHPLEFILKAACLSSSAMLAALLLGQTSVVGAGALLLAIKPTYFFLGIAFLVISGCLTAAVGVVLQTSLLLLLLTLRMGWRWPLDYLASLALYVSASVPGAYAGIHLSTMNVFRTAFRGLLRDQVLVLISSTIVAVTTIGLCAAGMLNSKPSREVHPSAAVVSNPPRAFILLISVFLLFSTYLGLYEEILLITTLGIARLTGVRMDRFTIASLAYLAAVALTLNIGVFAPALMWPLWLIKAGVFAAVIYAVGGRVLAVSPRAGR
jgi:hypothetical protein